MAEERRTRSTRTRSSQSREEAPARRPRRRSRGSTAGFVALYIVAVIGVSILLACIGWIAANDVLALNKAEKKVTVTITKEDSFGDVASMLKKEGLIEYKSLFHLFATITGGKDKISPGTYTLNTDMDYRALISGMSMNSSTKAVVTVTIPEGYTIQQIFQLLEDKGVSTVEELTKVAAEHDYAFSFLQDIPLGDANRLEGFLYPDTYEFNTPHSALYAINKMLVNFDRRFDDEMRAAAQEKGYSVRDIVIIASMIEKETDGTDQAHIASVIYNRLTNTSAETVGLLGIDATLVYALGRPITQDDYQTADTPYNTYKYQGLPPGPISNPGMVAIRAAMNPDSTSDYYYVLGNDGKHHFFKTLKGQQDFIAQQQAEKRSG